MTEKTDNKCCWACLKKESELDGLSLLPQSFGMHNKNYEINWQNATTKVSKSITILGDNINSICSWICFDCAH